MPRLQDPQLNTVECVIEGHEPDISATGRSAYIRAILWLSCLFTVLFGPLLALATLSILQDLKKATSNSDPSTDAMINITTADTGANGDIHKMDCVAMYKALKSSSYLFLLVEFALIFALVSFGSGGPWDIYVIIVLIPVEGLLMGVFIKRGSFSALKFLPTGKQRCCDKCKLSFLQLVIFLCANWTAYHFCWLMIGVMINPLWGVILLLFICVSVAAFIFAAYLYRYTCPKGFSCFAFVLCAAFVLSVWSLFVVVGLAGQSFYGRETADDIVILVTLAITTASFSWILSIIKGGVKSESPG